MVLTLDATIAIIFVIAISAALSTYFFTAASESSSASFIRLHFASEDILDVLNKMGVLDTIGDEWTSGNQSLAANLSEEYLDQLVPANMGYRMTFDDSVIVENARVPESRAAAETHSLRLLAGFSENRTSIGSVSRAFITGITSKTSSAYAYFGGFVGQGNLTRHLHVPDGAEVTGAYMELDAGAPFDMYVNSQSCGSYSPGGGYLEADIKEDVSDCAFSAGTNTIELRFTGGNSSDRFIGGGFVRVTYNTSALNESGEAGQGVYEFPGIDGFINHFSSFYVPGTLTAMSAHLEFDNNYTTYLKIGDVLVYNSTGSPSKQTVDLDDAYLSGKLNYNTLSKNTVPIRLGTSNVSQVVERGNADVVLITDLSGSMMHPIGADSGTGTLRACNDSALLDNDTRRISLAKCLDKDFIGIILNSTGNRVGLVGFNGDAYADHSLSTDASSLKGAVDDYPDSPSGGTCVCCAINRAYNMLEAEAAPGKDKYIIVMSDGITGYCCGITGWWWWAECDDQGTSTIGRFSDCAGNSSDCAGPQCDGAISNAIWSSGRARDNLEATVHAVGFGPVGGCENANYTLHQVAASGNGSYCHSANATELKDCYIQFAQGIVDASVKSQVVNLTGSVAPSKLYPDSYISYTYTPLSPALEYGEVTMSYDTGRFNDTADCEGTFYIPADVGVVDAKATSYSSEHWTHYLHIDNSNGIRALFRLSNYGSDYFSLGDPYIVSIRPDYIEAGENNTIKIMTGDSADNETGCSPDNRAILTIKLRGSVGYGDVFPESEGCDWTIEFEDGGTLEVTVPEDYEGSSRCSYMAGNITYREDDAQADAVYRLLRNLDMDDDGRADVKFDASQLDLDLGQTGGVRSLWGPAKLKLVVWM